MISSLDIARTQRGKYRSFLIATGLSIGLSQAAEPEKVLSPADARAMVGEWVQVEKLITEEQNNWERQQAAMLDLLELYQTEVELINEELEAAGDSTSELDDKSEQLKQQTAAYQKQREVLELQCLKHAKRFVELSQRFPQPLQDQIKREVSIVEDTESTLRERSIALLDALKSAGQFNRTITYTDLEEEVEGTTRQLRVLYLGLGQAFYVSGEKAGIGRPEKGSWKWQEVPNSKASISKAIAVYQKTARPELITLPVESK
ncbi:DUF3450 family protein [Rubritalea spongiae]|uniref:DUF3450 family protein n=1 Tax=Rubritalea spongiae TaxID=430797 RepID=A0ABW5E1R6_9BACT